MTDSYKVFNKSSIKSFNIKDWNNCNNSGNVFLSYNFLLLLEESNSINVENGWEPIYFGLKKNEILEAVVPCFIKYHSQGEFVFDHAWAQAYQRYGLDYYPKLLIASPFTPVTGKRFLTRESDDSLARKKLIKSIKEFCNMRNISSIHVNFFDKSELYFFENEDFIIRFGEQFHFINKKYNSFDNFLETMSYKNRKKIKKEREFIKNIEVDIEVINANNLTEELCDKMYKFYISTINKKWSYNYLSKEFFLGLPYYLRNESLLILAKSDKEIIGGALNFLSNNNLYGRYWGSSKDIKYLHFEVCYYKAIEIAINNNYLKVEAGAQGAHKIKRGYTPQITYSAHYIFNSSMRKAIEKYVSEERKIIKQEINFINSNYSPFKIT